MLSDAAPLFTFTSFPQAPRVFAYLVVTQVICSVVLTRNGTARRRMARLLAAQAGVDPLTGLATRRVLDEAVQRAMVAGQHQAGVALLLIDVDRFKTINDTYGHPVGDAALQHLAQVLAKNLRPDAVIGRLGGDELAVLLPGCEHAVALARAEHLVEAVRGSPLHLPDVPVPDVPGPDDTDAQPGGGTVLQLSVSIGVAHAPAQESGDLTHLGTLTHLYADADASLYQAKRGGRGRVGSPC